MKIPTFWKKHEGGVRKPDGAELHVFAWGWSDTSDAEAEARARERFGNIQQRVSQGLELPKGYGYGSRPLREQILRTIPAPGSSGQIDALLTRNAYGSVVLNAARAMFIDVDAPASAFAPASDSAAGAVAGGRDRRATGASGASGDRGDSGDSGDSGDRGDSDRGGTGIGDEAGVVGFIAKLLGFGGGRDPSAPLSIPPASVQTASAAPDAGLDQVRRAISAANLGAVRLYRTAGGFRLLVTDRVYAPGSPDAESAMRAVGADPAFMQLCKVQDSFRARLTPKPWRVGQSAPPGNFPRETSGQQRAFDRWLEKYERATAARATCQFIEIVGHDVVHSDVAPILGLHDEQTKATSSLPLA